MGEIELADRRAAMRTMPKLQPFDDKTTIWMRSSDGSNRMLYH